MKKILLIAAAAFASVTCFAQKFGCVNSTELVQLCPEADEARTTLQASSKEAQDTYKDMVDEFNKKYESYQQNNAKWSAATLESKQKELQDFQQRIQDFSQNIQQELAQQEQTLFAPIAEKVRNTIDSIAKAKALAAVFEATSLPYLDKNVIEDITPEARKVLGIPEGKTLESLQAEMQAAAQAAQ